LLGVPITKDTVSLRTTDTSWASRPLVAQGYGHPIFSDIASALTEPGTDIRLFGKPTISGHRRVAVALASGTSQAQARQKTLTIVNSLETKLS
jgi:phosphoribosylglycinamide formyltransferase 2